MLIDDKLIFDNDSSAVELDVAQIFFKQASQHPHHLAIKSKNYQWSYRSLADQVTAIYHSIKDTSILRIALLLPHDAPMLAAMLASTAAGKMFIPLDVNYPAERLRFIIEDASVHCIITDSQSEILATKIFKQDTTFINIDKLNHADDVKISLTSNINHLAYMIYTSGSTGKPKGVYQNQRNLLHHWRCYSHSLKITSDDKLSVLSSFCFDAAIMDIFGALLNGATLCPFNLREQTLSECIQWLQLEGITIYHSTPTVFRLLMKNAGENLEFSRVRHVVLGGEAVFQEDFMLFCQHFSNACQFTNNYGPTESTLAAQFSMTKQTSFQRPKIPVGYAVPSTEIILLDQNGNPTDVFGEIALHSPYLACGYWQQPELTATAFPIIQNKRFYRTGDGGRLLPSGAIEYMGRLDTQVKIRGHRIELAEIESCLQQHPAIKQAIAITQMSHDNELRIIVYYISDMELNDQLYDYVRNILPDYMHPALYQRINAIPLTANGKLDHHALRKIPIIQTQKSDEPIKSEVELRLSRLWEKLLGIQNVKSSDNFFSKGGHSLLALQLIAFIKQEFNVNFPLRTLFNTPLLRQMAKEISELQALATMRNQALPLNTQEECKFIPLAPTQQKFWLFAQLYPENPYYNLDMLLTLNGNLCEKSLRRTIETLIEKHKILRTTFKIHDNHAIQIIHESITIPLKIMNIESEEMANQLIRTEILRTFNLESGPLVRFVLIKLGQDYHKLLIVFHHIILDGWSQAVFLNEFVSLYNSQEISPLFTKQYATYAIAQQKWLNEVLPEQLHFWQTQLANPPEPLKLSFSKTSSLKHSSVAVLSAALPESLISGLTHLAVSKNCSLFMLLLSAYTTLIFRYSNQEDMIIGVPIANRSHDVENMLGCFVNVLPFRMRFDGNKSFDELLKSVRELSLTLLEQPHAPLETIQEKINLNSAAQLFQILFTLQTIDINHPELNGLKTTVDFIDIDTQSLVQNENAFLPLLSLLIRPTAQNFMMVWEFDTKKLTQNAVVQIMDDFTAILNAILEMPQQKITQLPLRSTEYHEWYIPQPIEKNTLIHQMITTQANLHPQQISAVYQNQILTYSELNRKADIIAFHLISNGIKCNDVVGICLEKSLEAVICILGVMKSGAAFLPLDASMPIERLDYMLQNSRAKLLLTTTPKQQNFNGLVLSIKLLLDDRQQVSTAPYPTPSLDDLAYVIYTSGSTGNPKGVMVSHKNLMSTYKAWENVFQFDSVKNYLQLANFSFDVFIADIVKALCSGGKLIIAPAALTSEPKILYEIIKTEEIDTLDITPTQLKHLLAYVTQENLAFNFLKILNIGSDRLSLQDYYQIKTFCGKNTRVLNSYGLTETTIDSCYYESTCDTDFIEDEDISIIGKPLSHNKIHILGKYLQPMPYNIWGEIYVEGDNVTQGYINHDELTEHYFSNSHSKLFKTGDAGCILNDLNIQFGGRLDSQISIGGLRIEPFEIETKLNQHEAIEASVVLSNDQQLIAFIVPRPKKVIETKLLADYLSQSLPYFMIPQLFILIDELPKTVNGKIDSKVLLTKLTNKSDVFQKVPYTPIQEIISDIWRSVLNINDFGIHDNFFDLGGHSLLAMQVISRINKEFSTELPPFILFKSNTVATIADELMTKNSDFNNTPTTILSSTSDDHAPLTFIQKLIWSLCQQSNLPIYDVSFALDAIGDLNIKILQQSFNEVYKRHSALRTSFHKIGENEIQQIINEPKELSLSTIDLTLENDASSKALVLIKEIRQQTFDLTKSPLIKATIFHIAKNKYLLYFNIHHLIIDDWSINLFIQELWTIYHKLMNQIPLADPAPQIQYHDYARWQSILLQQGAFESHLKFWQNELNNYTPLVLLTDFQRPSQFSYKGDRYQNSVPNSLYERIKQFCRTSNITIYMFSLAIYSILLSQFATQKDITILAPLSTRNRVEFEYIIGLLLNWVPVRTCCEANKSFRTLIQEIKHKCINIYRYIDLPFEVFKQQIAKDNLHLFPASLAYIYEPSAEQLSSYSDITLKSVELPPSICKREVCLYISDNNHELTLNWVYSTDLFKHSTIEAMANRYLEILTKVLDQPELLLSQV